MIEYSGERSVEGDAMVRVIVDGDNALLPPCNDIRNHSPSGFEWGYNGSGPAQLALALCVHALDGDHKRAVYVYQTFKFNTVAKFGDKWRISKSEIIGLIKQIEDEPEAA